MDILRAYRAPSDRLHSSSIPTGGEKQQRHPEVVTDAEAKDQLWSISQRYESLLKLQRDFADAQRAYFEGERFKEAAALSDGETELWLRAQKVEREAKLQVLQRRVLLLQSLQELRQIQLQDLAGHIRPARVTAPEVVWQDDRPQRHPPQSPGSARSEASEPDAEAGPFPALLLAATRAELEALQQRERELVASAESPTAELCDRLAVSEQNLAKLMHQTASAKRLAEGIAWKQLNAESEARQATVAADLLQAAMEVQDEEMKGIQRGSCAASVAVPAESAPATCNDEASRHSRPAVAPLAPLAPELLSLVMEEVGFASEQLAALSPWRSEVSGAGEETPSTRVQSLSEVDIPQSFQVRQWRSPAEESTVSTSPSPCRIPATLADAHTDGIDLALASFLSPRRNRLRRSLFSREGRGLYRYGTCRLQLRFAQGELEASGRDVEAWEPLEDFLRKVEVDQSQRLQRARERAKALRKP